MKNKIAICISTRNRAEAFDESLREWTVMAPWSPNITCFVVDDASQPRYCSPDYYFTERVGIPNAKNKCLELAMDWGAEHIFLCDDDLYPISPDCLTPYIESPCLHLCYTFLPHNKTDGTHKYHQLGNGCLMYIHRSVVEKIGGFDPAFGLGAFEHVQYSYRAYAAGLIPHPFIDVVGSDKLFHSLDQNNEISRTFTSKEKHELIARNRAHYYKTRMFTDFIPYK